jgi:hypothetical protein
MRIARLPLVLLTACTAAEAGPGPAPLRFTL